MADRIAAALACMATSADIPPFPARIWLAFVCFFRLLIDGEFAREVQVVRARGGVPSGPMVEAASTLGGFLSGSPVIPTPAAAPTPAEAAAERVGIATESLEKTLAAKKKN